MNQLNSFKPAPGIIPDYTSMVIDGFNYGNGICKGGRPDMFVVLNTGQQGLVSVDCGRLKIASVCGTQSFILDRIVRREVGSHVLIECCTAATKHKVELKCKPAGNCDTNLMRVNLKKFEGCDTAPVFADAAKDFNCSDTLTCTEKVAAFVAAANKLQTLATYSVGADPEIVVVEWKADGEPFQVISWDGFYDPEVVTFGKPAVGKGSDLRNIFSDVACLPGACAEDKCYKIYAFLYEDYISQGDGLFSSSTGVNSNNAKTIVHKLVWIAAESSATAVHTALITALNGGTYPLACTTACISESEHVTKCISRTDDGDGAALADIISDYSADNATAVRTFYIDGVSYYDVTILASALPFATVVGDTISHTSCGPDEPEIIA